MSKNKKIPNGAEKVFGGVLFDVYHWEQEMFDGSRETFERLRRPDTALVLPVTEDGEIIILKQEQPTRGVFYSLPGGQIEEGEESEIAAAREMQEESGYMAESLDLWVTQEPHNKIDWRVYVYIGKNCKPVSRPNLDAGERIEVIKISVEEFVERVFNCEIREIGVLFKMLKEGVRDDERGFEIMRDILF